MDFVQQYWYWVLLAVASGGFLIYDIMRSIGDTSVLAPLDATLKINRENAHIIDVRDQSEFSQGHLPNARHIPAAELTARQGELEKLVRDAPLILYCASGVRSSGAVRQLRKAGFEQVFNLRGGINEWERAGLPVTAGRDKLRSASAKGKSKGKGKNKESNA